MQAMLAASAVHIAPKERHAVAGFEPFILHTASAVEQDLACNSASVVCQSSSYAGTVADYWQVHHAAMVQVHLLARGEKLRASRALQDRVLEHDKVTVHFNTIVDDAYPDGKGALAGLHTKDTKTGSTMCCTSNPSTVS